MIYISIFFTGSFAAWTKPGAVCISGNIYAAKNIIAYGEIEKIDLLHHGYDMPKDNREKTLTFMMKADSIVKGEYRLTKNIQFKTIFFLYYRKNRGLNFSRHFKFILH